MFGNHSFGPTVTALVVRHSHRILDDRIEKSIKEDKLDNAHLPQVYLRCKDCIRLFRSGVKEEGGWTDTTLVHPPTTPIPHARPVNGLWVPPPPPLCVNIPSADTFFIVAILLEKKTIQTFLSFHL